MKQKKNRIIAFLLALALITTTFATNEIFTHVWADEQETIVEEETLEQESDEESKQAEETNAEEKEETNEVDEEELNTSSNNAKSTEETKVQKSVEQEVDTQATEVTMAEIDAFIDANFPDANFAAATKQAVRDYYQFDGADNDIFINDSDDYNDEGIGPKTFSTPEEALSWLGEFNINVKALDIECVEGLQYLGKEYVIETGEDKDIKLVLTGGVDIQKLFGKLCSSSTLLYCRVTSDDIYSVGRLTEDGYSGNKSTLTLPRFYSGSVQIATLTNTTKKTPLVYLRDGKEKQFYVYDDVKKSATGEDLIKEGLTTWDIGKLTSETESDRWKMVSKGSDETNVKWNLNLNNWDRFETKVRAVSGQISYNFEYKLSVAYYSYVDVDFNCEIYGGFEFKKVSENNKELSLEGAQFVVSNEAGEYLVSEGGNGKTAEFSTDITKAKIYTSGADGTFKVERIPVANADDANENGQVTATYYVTEVKAASGYKLDSTPVPVTVTASVAGIATEYAGGETNVKVNSDNLKLYPQWEKENQLMVLSDGTTTANEKKDAETHDLYIKNAGKEITTMKYELEKDAKDNYEILQNPSFTINNLKSEGDEVGSADSLEGVKDKINGIIAGKKDENTGEIEPSMKTVDDSYKVVTEESLIYYDKASISESENKQKENTPLPVNLKFAATKNLVGGELVGNEFEFTLEADTSNPEEDPLKDKKVVKNDADGNIDFGQVSYTKAGTYKYTLKETQGIDNEITYDTEKRTIEIVVEETGTNGLTATIKVNGTKIGNCDSSTTNIVEYPHLEDDKFISEDILQTVKENHKKITTTEFVNSKGLTIEKTSPTDTKPVEKNDEITYQITVKNPLDEEQKTTVYDTIPSQLELVSYTISGVDGKETKWPESGKEITVPAAKMDGVKLVEGETTITFTCKVKAEYQADDVESNIILNQAYMQDDKGKITYTKTVANVLMPSISYEMTKARVVAAPKKDGTDKYGFAVGTEGILYEQTITNTGTFPLSMCVKDAFSEEEDANGKKAADNFENLEIIKVVIKDKEGKESVYTADDANIFIGFGTPDGELKDLAAKASAIITYRADVKSDATESLDSKKYNKTIGEQTGSNESDAGYKNTATATDVKAVYDAPTNITITDNAGNVIYAATVDERGNVSVTENSDKQASVGENKPVIQSKEINEFLEDKKDTDRTPIQVPNISYTMEKGRITKADKNGDAKTYGFVKGDKVEYEVTVTNNGNLPITMDVTDSFADADKFKDLAVKEVKNAKENGDAADGIGKNITISAGEKAVIIFTATVDTDIVNLDEADNRDWTKKDNEEAKGYINTAKTSNVSAEYKYKDADGKEQTIVFTNDGAEGTVKYPNADGLAPKEDIANTPVRPIAGYKISKARIDAPQKDGVDGAYGFKIGDTVTYTIVVENTGTMDLTMTVEDAFAETNYFENLTYTEVENAEWNNNATGAATEEAPNITVKADTKATITVTAKVANETPEMLSDKAEYYVADKEASPGYENTVTATIEAGSYTDANGTEHTVKKEDYPDELLDKEATCTTPVQVTPKVSYTFEKARVQDAGESTFVDGYGFAYGESVEYAVTIENTGEIALTMDVTDEFTAADRFANLEVIKVEDAEDAVVKGVEDNGKAEAGIGENITIPVGGKAVVTFKATIDTNISNLDDAENRDWSAEQNEEAKGYVNTASAANVCASYTTNLGTKIIYTSDGADGTVKYPSNVDEAGNLLDNALDAKADVANTPVRPTLDYEIEKTRIQAPEKDGDSSQYGFKHGDIVTYTLTVKNKGSVCLTMTVEDTFANAGYFTALTYTKVEGAVWNNNASGAATEEVPNITVQAGATATITVTAKVSETAPELLSDKAEYYSTDKKVAPGYENTVTVMLEKGTYSYIDENGVEQQVELLPTDYPEEFKSKSATCTTPVQVDDSVSGDIKSDKNTDTKVNIGPKTGDSTRLGIYVLGILVSIIAIVLLLLKKKIIGKHIR